MAGILTQESHNEIAQHLSIQSLAIRFFPQIGCLVVLGKADNNLVPPLGALCDSSRNIVVAALILHTGHLWEALYLPTSSFSSNRRQSCITSRRACMSLTRWVFLTECIVVAFAARCHVVAVLR